MKPRTLVIIGAALAASGIAVGLVVTPGPFGTPPLGTTANWSTSLQCSPGKTLANGFYELHNYSGETVAVTGVRLVGGAGQRMSSAAYLVPIQHTRGGWLRSAWYRPGRRPHLCGSCANVCPRPLHRTRA